MSFSSEQEIRCPCGEEFESTLWSSVNVKEDPDLKEVLLAGRLNVATCPLCEQVLYAERFVLYHDPSLELMAFVYPKEHEAEPEVWIRKMEDDFNKAQGSLEAREKLDYRPISLFGLDALVRLIEEEQEKMDQGAILEYLSKSIPVEVKKIRPSLARQAKVPPVLPLSKDHQQSLNARFKKGLQVVLKANDRLSLYARLLEQLSNNRLDVSGL
ncbi:MAG: hypothetical protein HY548_02805 [Elusimicrobia bacterium]|nr:hypothetical protein [Elusimicrobiota bacterium]